MQAHRSEVVTANVILAVSTRRVKLTRAVVLVRVCPAVERHEGSQKDG